jgi:glucose-6-phosphate dehydrogenase assembly protein OpcA
VRVVITEDSVLLREGLLRLLTEYDHEVVAALGDAHQLVDTVTLLEPDLRIGDVRMPPTSTDEGLRAIGIDPNEGDAGAGEVVVLKTSGPLANHASSVVLPFLLPDTPVVAWWPGTAPDVPAQDPLGRLAIRRITDATRTENPLAVLRSRITGYTQGDTDLAWSRITYWRALLASALEQPPYEPISGAVVSGLADEPALDILAGWLASRIDGPVRREVGELKVELTQPTQTITLSRPQEGSTATLSRTGRPDAQLPLARRETRECLAEDMRRLDADEVYQEALAGLEKVQYPGAGSA